MAGLGSITFGMPSLRLVAAKFYDGEDCPSSSNQFYLSCPREQVTVTDDDASHSHVDLDLSPQTPPLSEPEDEVIFEPDEDEPPSKSYVERRNRDGNYEFNA